MGAESKIQWTHHSFNPWWGCQRVSPGCQRCYAETFAKRTGNNVWGPTAPRRLFGEKHWAEPLKWAKAAAKAGERHRVFCASMADVFEDRPELAAERERLWRLIRATERRCSGCDLAILADEKVCIGGHDRPVGGLDWLLLTKRPENVLRMAPADILPLVWIGTTVEDQERANERIPELHRIPARVRFLSCEPLLGPVDLSRTRGEIGAGLHSYEPLVGRNVHHDDYNQWTETERIDWVIVGGESGPGARPFDLAWARSIRDQCAAAGVACFVKQLGAGPFDSMFDPARAVLLEDRKGGDPSEWPEDLRVRQFPEVRHG